MLAADTFLVNFQFDEATPPSGYLRDTGQVFGDRGDGLSYGWSTDHADQSRERSLELDQRFDTLIHFEAGQIWEFALADGLYEVTVAVGDPANNDGVHTINVEGLNYWDAEPDGDGPMVLTDQVTVSDGRLTIDAGASAEMATRINYVQIVGLPEGPNAPPTAPFVTEPMIDGQVVNPSDVHLEAVGFSDPDGDGHQSTDWEIWTVGPSAELAWQTLGIEGVERLHTHLGDGIFVNSLAGEIELASNTEYELRVRFRDGAGSASAYSTRGFVTGASSTIFPLELEDIRADPVPAWVEPSGLGVELPVGQPILSPADPIIAIDLNGGSSSPSGEDVGNAIDGDAGTKYLNFGELNSGFIVTPASGPSVVTSFQITTANDAPERDPTNWALFGTNDPITSGNNSTGSREDWVLVDSGTVALPIDRFALGPVVEVAGSTAYTSYRMVFQGVRNSATANSMQIAEIQFFGDQAGATPPSLSVQTADGSETLLSIVGSAATGNTITDFPAIENHDAVRIVIEAGSNDLSLNRSDLAFTAGDGRAQTVFLPAVDLPAGGRLDLWVDAGGATYFGAELQTEPDFSLIARPSDLTIPYIATRPGFVIEEVASDLRLPVNIAFVPNPGPNPDDPLFYVTELYGSIQVVTRDGTRHEFATGLLDYNPEGPISGSGEQGLTGITVVRDEADPEIYHLFIGLLADNGSPPGGAVHFPQVRRLTSTAGGLSVGTSTLILNMQPETQGQSHQISNITIGPDDGKLYVHNGDGFVSSTAQNLDQFRGKILRLNLDGTPAEDNPFFDASDGISARDYVWAYGLRNPFGGAWRASDGQHYEVENGPSIDRLARVSAGQNLGWDGSNASLRIGALYNWEPAHAPVNITFVQRETFNGSQFPAELLDRAFVSESGPTYAAGPQALGKRISEFNIDAGGELVGGPETLIEYVGTGRGSVVGLAAGPDGLYFTELYEDSGANGPTAQGSRVFRVRFVNPLEGDYDIDGDVDQDDYEVWSSTFGSNLLLAADGNGDGVVNIADYTVWRDNLGATLTAASNAESAVSLTVAGPEAPDATGATALPRAALGTSAAITTVSLPGFQSGGVDTLFDALGGTSAAEPVDLVDDSLLLLLASESAAPAESAEADDQAFADEEDGPGGEQEETTISGSTLAASAVRLGQA